MNNKILLPCTAFQSASVRNLSFRGFDVRLSQRSRQWCRGICGSTSNPSMNECAATGIIVHMVFLLYWPVHRQIYVCIILRNVYFNYKRRKMCLVGTVCPYPLRNLRQICYRSLAKFVGGRSRDGKGRMEGKGTA